jgi:hypothetical protein
VDVSRLAAGDRGALDEPLVAHNHASIRAAAAALLAVIWLAA